MRFISSASLHMICCDSWFVFITNVYACIVLHVSIVLFVKCDLWDYHAYPGL